VGEDGHILCLRRTGDQPGFVFLGQTKDHQWGQYRRADDPTVQDFAGSRDRGGDRLRIRPENNGTSHRPDWTARAAECAQAITPGLRTELAEALGLPECVLSSLQVGYCARGPHAKQQYARCWTFPEVDAGGCVLGILCRYDDGSKLRWPGANAGLLLPTQWAERDGPLLLPEGPSDTLALAALNLAAVGRPSNTGGVEHLAELLRHLPAERSIVVLGENGPKMDGSGRWPGLEGAKSTAAALAAELGRPVCWALPPDGAKDARAWLQARGPDLGCADELHDLGDRLREWVLSQRKPEHPERATGFRWRPLNSAAFAAGDYRPTWLVQRLLVRGMPGVMGAPKKTLKTSIMVDLAVSLASGRDFLGHWKVYRPVRVAMLSGESGQFALQDTARRVCRAKGIDLADLQDMLLWMFELPQLANGAHVRALQEGLRAACVEVLLFDPLYLALLSGVLPGQINAENLFHIGPLLLSVTSACLEVGCTPFMVHHSRKHLPLGEVMELDDLSYSGIAEFARQWLLLSRREKFDPEAGLHHLYLNAGGSTGQSGLWAVDVTEGVLGEHFDGRTWEVTIQTAGEARQETACERERARTAAKDTRDRADETEVLNTLDRLTERLKGPPSFNRVRDEARLSKDRVGRAVCRLEAAGFVERVPVQVTLGSKSKRTVEGLRRRKGNSA
jgi:hypothetical protein